MLVDLRNKSFASEPELVRHRDNFLTGELGVGTATNIPYDLPFVEEVVVEEKSERKAEEEVEIIMKNEEWEEEQEMESIEDDTETEEPEITVVPEPNVNKPGRKRKSKLQ